MNEVDKKILELAIEYQRILPTLGGGEALYMAKKAYQDCNPSRHNKTSNTNISRNEEFINE